MTDIEKGVMNFFFKKEVGRCLSNFWECEVRVVDEDGERVYNSGESCFQGEKFIRLGKVCTDENRKTLLLKYGSKFLKGVCVKDGSVVKKMGRQLILSNGELALWYNLSIDVQREICRFKYDNYEEVRRELYASVGRVLIHPAMRCNEEKVKGRLWEGKGVIVDGKIKVIGKNMLGKLWMELRDM